MLPAHAHQEEARKKLQEMQAEILKGAQLVHGKTSRRMERKIGADIAAVRSLPEQHNGHDNSDNEDAHQGSEADSIDSGDSDNDVDMEDPDWATKINVILSDSVIVQGTRSDGEDVADVFKNLIGMMQYNPDSAGRMPPKTTFHSVRSEQPRIEYGENDNLFYLAFPTLFLFGRGLPKDCSTLPDKIVRHLLLQFNNKFAKDSRFYYAAFNQLQRHANSRAAVMRVKNSKQAIVDFNKLIHEPELLRRLTSAVQDPSTDDAKMLARKMLPLVTSVGSSVPYSPSERRDMFPRLVSSMYRVGTGFIFLTCSFDDKNNTLAVRFATPLSSNSTFPARDGGLQYQMHNRTNVFEEEDSDYTMKIDDVSLLRLISDSPVAAVQFFKKFFEAFLEILVGLPPPTQLDEVPLHHHSRKGLWGRVTDTSLVHETNGRSLCNFV